jgi:hypothetical protein
LKESISQKKKLVKFMTISNIHPRFFINEKNIRIYDENILY